MVKTKHERIKYAHNHQYDNSIDSISKVAFLVGEEVVACSEKNGLISWRSLKDNNYECPFCRKKLSSDLTITGSANLYTVGKSETPSPSRQQTASPFPTFLFGGTSVFMLLCLVVSAIGVFSLMSNYRGGTSTPKPVTLVVATSTSIRPRPSSTPIQPIATSIQPRPTQTRASQALCSGAVVTSESTSKGNYLHVNPCSGSDYDLGPLANGSYVIAPNDKFLVYVSAGDGSVYAARIGDTSLTKLGNLKKDHKFTAFIRDETPSFRLVISGSTVTIYEDVFKQNASYPVPSRISQ